MILLAASFTAFALWFGYNAALAYPRFNERGTAYNRIAVEEARRAEWLDLAEQNGWPPQFEPEDMGSDQRVMLKSSLDTQIQLGLGGLCLVAAVGLAVRFLLARGRVLVLDDEGLVTAKGELVPLDRIVRIDLQQWERRGIVTIRYEDELGQRRSTTLDGWVFSNIAEILERIAADPRVAPAQGRDS
jgi:hypothetical protein